MDRVQEELENKRLNAKNKIYNIDRNNEVAFSDKYDFEDEYLSDNAKKEKKQEISKKSNKRGFKKTIANRHTHFSRRSHLRLNPPTGSKFA